MSPNPTRSEDAAGFGAAACLAVPVPDRSKDGELLSVAPSPASPPHSRPSRSGFVLRGASSAAAFSSSQQVFPTRFPPLVPLAAGRLNLWRGPACVPGIAPVLPGGVSSAGPFLAGCLEQKVKPNRLTAKKYLLASPELRFNRALPAEQLFEP